MSNDDLIAEGKEVADEVAKAKAFALKQLKQNNEILSRGGGISSSSSEQSKGGKLTVCSFTNKMQELTKMLDAVSELEQRL